MAKTPAWQRKAGKNPKGGLTAKARTGKGLKGKTNKTSSQSKGLGSVKQSRRKTKSGGNLKAKQI